MHNTACMDGSNSRTRRASLFLNPPCAIYFDTKKPPGFARRSFKFRGMRRLGEGAFLFLFRFFFFVLLALFALFAVLAILALFTFAALAAMG